MRGGGGGCTEASARVAARASTRGCGHECLRVMCAHARARVRALARVHAGARAGVRAIARVGVHVGVGVRAHA
eukprot:2200946-Pleurochrysis_carterae.AAC.1